MKTMKFSAGLHLSLATLLGTMALSPAFAAKNDLTVKQHLRRLPTIRISSYGPRQITITPSTDPKRLMSQEEWARFVRTQMPQMGNVDQGPFAVLQNRRFERGDTLVPPSVHTF